MMRTEVAFKPYWVEVFTSYRSKEAAQAVADTNNAAAADDPPDQRWTYAVQETKAGTFVIVTYDEDGFCLGPL